MGVAEWIEDVLNPQPEEGERTVKVTVRLEIEDAADLDRLARWLNLSRTACATGLLTAAIGEALEVLPEVSEGTPIEQEEADRLREEERALSALYGKAR